MAENLTRSDNVPLDMRSRTPKEEHEANKTAEAIETLLRRAATAKEDLERYLPEQYSPEVLRKAARTLEQMAQLQEAEARGVDIQNFRPHPMVSERAFGPRRVEEEQKEESKKRSLLQRIRDSL